MPSLASIAAELGVSRTTVSNAYNRPEQLSPELRERILAVAAAHGYAGPDPMARSLRTQRTGAIGVVLTEALSFAFEDRASVDFLAGLASVPDYSLTLIPAGASVHDAIVDGIVVYSVPAADPHLTAARARGLPLIVCDQPKGLDVPFVGIDDFHAIQATAQLLIDAGHTRIGILAKRMFASPTNGFVDLGEVGDVRDVSSGLVAVAELAAADPAVADAESAVAELAAVDPAVADDEFAVAELAAADLDVQRARVEGALEVFSRAGVGPVPVVTRHLNDIDAAADGARELLGRFPDLTAVLCTTDSMALGVMAAFGDRVADGSLSVTGFDGIDEAVSRGLVTVSQPSRRKGEVAAELLRSLMDGGGGSAAAAVAASADVAAPQRIILDTTLIAGTTVTRITG